WCCVFSKLWRDRRAATSWFQFACLVVVHDFRPPACLCLARWQGWRAAPSSPDVPARVVAGATNNRAALAFEEVAPLHAARTSQRDVPTTLNTYHKGREKHR